ncbi:MAG: hypothetical protein WKG07_42055 [Hymenobacter sp.]
MRIEKITDQYAAALRLAAAAQSQRHYLPDSDNFRGYVSTWSPPFLS